MSFKKMMASLVKNKYGRGTIFMWIYIYIQIKSTCSRIFLKLFYFSLTEIILYFRCKLYNYVIRTLITLKYRKKSHLTASTEGNNRVKRPIINVEVYFQAET